jgi:twitching motility protein PilT
LAASLSAVVSQRLLRRRDGTGRIGAYEILVMTDAMRHLVREGRTEQMRNFMQTGSRLGMQTLEQDLAALRRKALI